MRLTLDPSYVVKAIEVTTNDAPYEVCPSVAPGYQKLVGARIGAGWRKAVTDAVGRTRGCTRSTPHSKPSRNRVFLRWQWPAVRSLIRAAIS